MSNLNLDGMAVVELDSEDAIAVNGGILPILLAFAAGVGLGATVYKLTEV